MNALGWTVGMAGLIAAYWAPWFIAWRRHVPNVGSVFVINFFAFLLGIPWIVALVMAVRTRPAAVPAAPEVKA